MTLRLAVFDCDGTLVDSQAAICDSMEQAFAEAGETPPTREAVRRIVGLSLDHAVAALAPALSAIGHEAIVEHYRRAFFARRAAGTLAEPLFDGIEDALAALDADGWLLGVATGKSARGLNHLLARHGLEGRFVTRQTADLHPSKPHPAMLYAAIAEAGAEPADTVMIGDTSFDIAMARAAGVRPIGVAWGYHSRDDLFAAGAEVIAEHPRDLRAILKVPA